MSQIISAKAFQSKNITISALKTLPSGAKQAYLNYNGEKLLMQTAMAMSLPFGLNMSEFGSTPEYSIGMSFRGVDQNPEMKEFMDVITQLDELLLQEGVKHSKLWFKAPLSKDVVQAFYTPTLKFSKDKEGNVLSYPPTIKLKLRKINNEFDTKMYDIKGNPYTNMPMADLLVKGIQVTAIMECGGVWFAGSKFGLTWRAKQIAIHKLPEKIGNFAFKGLSIAQEDEKESYSLPQQPLKSSQPQLLNDPVEEEKVEVEKVEVEVEKVEVEVEKVEEDPEEDGDDVEPIPVPQKTVIKKKIVTSKK